MKKVLFIGMPGSGKGTQARLLIPFGFKHINIGKIIRNQMKKKNSFLKNFKEHYSEGTLLSDDLISKIIKRAINSNKKYILDGAGRNMSQAKSLLKEKLIDSVIYFSLTEKIATERLKGRMKKSKSKRSDDNIATFKKRIEIFKKQTKPVLKLFKNKSKFYEIDASDSIKKIHDDVKRVLRLGDS